MTEAAHPVVVLGSTASGKSDAGLAAAVAVGSVDIVAVDALQVYRRMDIGTAKPTVAEQQAARHHGIDLIEPDSEMAVPEFRIAYDTALTEVARCGHRPLVVAGTGMYLTAVLDRLEVPGTYPAVRAELEAEPDTQALHARLTELDPLAASRMEASNRRRVVRALEVTLGSDRPFSSFGPGITAFPPTPVVQVGIRWPRPALTERVAQRVDRMMSAGLLDEVAVLHRSGMSRTAAQALGYKELIEHLQGRLALDDAVDQIKLRTRQFAVRQERWFRRDPRVLWIDIDPDHADPLAPVRSTLIELLNR